MPRRVALLVATYEYEDSMLEQLKGPAQDVEVLANVLSDPNIAGFDVDVLINQPHYVVGEAIGDFYQDRRRDDIALLYFTGHGLKDEEGRLYFAMKNTRRDRLLFTAIQANQIDEAIESCSSLQKVLILDCCYSGAFPAGRIAKGDSSVNSLETFRGKGRVVLTASDSTQYAFEGDRVSGKGQGSVFTRHLVGGLRTGEADLNGDGNITVDELYTFARDHVIEEMPNQHPKRQEDVEGAIILAQNVKWDFPSYVRHSLTSPIAADRLSALDSLTRLYRIGNETVRTRVIAEAHKMVEDDSRLVSSAAADLLAEAGRTGEDDRTEEAARQPAEDERQRAPDERGGSQPRLTTAAVAPDGGSDGPTTHEQVAREMPAESPISGQSPVALAGKSDVLSTDVPPTQPVRERGFRRVVLVLMAGLVLAAVLVVGIRGLNFSWPPSSTGVPTPSRSTAAQPRPTPSPAKKLDGGSYTWDSGVTLTTSFRLVEKWGVRHPYCEDGSCGSAKPDDVRVVLDYSVKVPKSLAAPVDPTGCPGSLLGTDSKGDGAVREISNAYAKPVNTPIKAGAKKAGVVEYSIRAKARGATFQIRSSCGDSDHLGEVAIFEGKIPRARKEETPGEIGGKAVKRTYLSLQVAQVRTDLDHNDFTALVETCVRKKLPDPKGAKKAAASWWSISTSLGTVRATPEWNVLLPVYPYGSFAKEDGCASGWIGFKLGRNTRVYSVAYFDRWGQQAVWTIRAAPTVRRATQPTIRPPKQPRTQVHPQPPTVHPSPETPEPPESIDPPPPTPEPSTGYPS